MAGNEDIIEAFYTSFAQRDSAAMIANYHADVHFSDPAFPDLHGDLARAMWQMLCERGKDLELRFSDITAHGDQGSAKWEATYTFSGTGRRVHNIISARFHFRDGKIVRHIDEFSMWRWTRQALGLPGLLLGWSPMIRSAVRRKARAQLDAFVARTA